MTSIGNFPLLATFLFSSVPPAQPTGAARNAAHMIKGFFGLGFFGWKTWNGVLEALVTAEATAG